MVMANTINRGSMARPGLMVVNSGKNCRMTRTKKKRLATRRNCSSRFLNTKLYAVYLAEITWFDAKIQVVLIRCRESYASSGSSWFTYTWREHGGGRFGWNAVSGFRSISRSFAHTLLKKLRALPAAFCAPAASLVAGISSERGDRA